MAKLNREQAFALASDREWSDIPKEYAQGANTFLSSALGSLDNSIVGDILRAVKGKPFREQVEMALSHPDVSQEEKDRIASEYLNADTILQQGQETLKDYSKFWASQKSKKTQALDRYVSEGEGYVDTIGRYAENPATIGLQSVGQLPQLLPVMGLSLGLRTKAAQSLLGNSAANTNAATALGALAYQSKVGGQQAREQSLDDYEENRPLNSEEEKAFNDESYKIDPSKINKNLGESDRYNAAKIATDSASKISAAAGLIGLKGDLALTNLLMGESIKGLSKKGLKAAGGHLTRNIIEETIDEAGSPLGANIGAQQTYDPTRDTFKDVGKQAAAGSVLGFGMGSVQAGGLYLFGGENKQDKQDTLNQHEKAAKDFEKAQQEHAQAQSAYDVNPTYENEVILAEFTDAAMQAKGRFDTADELFKQSFTPEEQEVIKAKTMEGVAARKKVADDAAKAQKELDDAQAKEQADIAAQQAEAIKTQRDEVISRLVPMLGDDVAISNELASLGLSEEDANTLLTDAHKEAKAQKKAQKKAGQQNQSAPKTPFELAVDEAFDANGNRNKAASQDIADKHGIKNIKTLIDAISERIDSNETKNKAAANEALAQKRQKEKQQADVLSEKQQLENTLADFAANNDHDSMVNFLRDYEPTEADKLIKNAYASVESKKKAEQDAIAATKKAEALKVKESEAKAQAEQKKIAFNNDMANLYAANPDRNPTKAELDSVGKKHGVKSPIELAQAWVKAKNEAKAAKEAAPKLALPSPETATKDERDITVPTGMNINRDNIENSDKEPIIVRHDGKPFLTQEAAEQAIKNKSKKKPRKNESPITSDTHEVIPVDGGFAIAPVVEIQQPKKPDDNEDGGVIADAPKPNAPVSPSGGTIPRAHLDGISGKLKDGKTVEEIATRIQKRLPHLTIEDVTQQVLAEQAKASKPATLDSVIGKYSDDEEVDAEIRQSGEVLKQFLPETIDDWKIDKSTFAVKGAWSVSYTKPYIVTDRKTGKEVVNSTTKSAPLDGDVLLSGDEQAIKDHIKERLTKNGITPRGVKNWQLDDAVSPTGQQAVDAAPTPMSERANRHKAHIETDDGKHIYEGTTGDSSFHYLWNEDADEVSLYRVKLIKNKDTGVVEGREISIFDPSTGKQIGTINSTGNKNLTDSALIISSINIGSAVQHYAQDPATLTQSERDANVKDLTQKALAVRIKLQEQKIAMGEEMGVSKAKREKEQAELDRLKGLLAPETQTGRKEAQQLADAIGVKIEKPSPIFETYKDALDWISEQSKKYASEKAFKATDLYKSVYEQVNLLYEQENLLYKQEKAKISAAKIKQMRDAGIDVGDKVKAFVVGSFLNGQTHYGVVVLRDGYPYVKLNEKVTVSSKGKLRDTSFVAWNDRWVKDAPTNNEPVPTKKPETKTETRGKIDFSSLTTESAVVDAWMSIKKGDIITTIVGGQLIAQTDFKNNPNMRFHRANGSEVASNIGAISGRPSAHIELAAKLKEQSKNELVKKLIGKTPEGNDLYEDGRGVRFTDNGRGVQVGEDVAITMQNGKTVYDVSGRTDEHRTVEEVAARQPKKLKYGDEGYTSDMANQDLSELYLQKEKNGMVEDDRLNHRIENLEKIFNILRANEPLGRKANEEKAEPTKEPSKKESLLIKIDDELDAALDDLAAIFKDQGNRLSSGVDPVIMGKVLAIGMKASTLYLAKGAVKFSIWAENMINGLSSKGVSADIVKPYLKQLYLASKVDISPEIRQQMDKEDDVYDFDFATLNENTLQDTQNVTTPSKTNGTNARERDKTPQSSQAQGVSESGLTQDNTEKRDDGVSADRGGRGDRGNLSNESGKSETRSQESNVASTGDKSPKLANPTRSPESSNGANLRNYRIQPNELKRTGTWKATAEQNVQIVELVKSIVAENRSATPEEKALLTKFTGWGASEIANGIFPNQYGQYKDANWKALGERLEAALTPEEYAQAKRTTQYAHYTSEPIIRSVYAALSRFGFNGGSMVEPGMGVGLFNGLMPDAMANNSQYTGIEYDTITGNIAKLLYPDSNVIVGDFTQTKLPKNFFDVAVGNPPFGSIKIQSDPEYKKQGFLLHDYFFAKTIDRVKEGGLLVFVTSKGTMDKANDRARKYLSERADLVGAIRLPQTAFKDNAGTEVVTDVIFLRKRTAEQEPSGESWGGLKEITTPQGNASINEYFANHPEMILGKSALTGSMYRANEYTVEPIAGSDIETLFSEAINNLPENIYKPQQGSKAEQAAVQRRDYDPKIKKEGGIYVADDGVLMQVSNGQGTPLTQKQNSKHELVDLKPKEKEWLKDYVGVRDALKQAQYDQLQDNSNWQKSLDALNKAYDAFVKKHGFMLDHTISERENEDGSVTVTKRFKNKSIMGLDAESALINALEQINGDNSISKAPALSGRVINKPSTPVITSTQDAMFVVFNELGRFDLAKVAKLINKSEKEVIAELGDSIYEDPSQSWTTSDDYLSGNVVRKLKEAEQAARLNPKYQRNVTALKAVQPPALAPQDISVQLGGAWIPASDVTAFASEILSERFNVSYSPLTGQWSVGGTANYSSEWGIPAKDSKDILEAVLNNRQIKVTYTDANKKTHTDTEKTEKANDIAKKMRQSFKKWLWEDVSRTERLVTYYNEHFNNIAPRVFDGQHLTLPGVSSRFDLRPHQKRAIWRTIQQGDVYYAHAVGAGKTFTMIASGMEERRLGLVKKPMYVVPNHMLAQFSKEFLELYPMANIMVADEANFHTHNRRKFVAQAALNNPDAIVITHSAFGRIGMSSEYSSKFIKNQIDDWQIALQEVGSDERITRKQIERRIEQLENKLKALLDGEKDQLLNFEELGVDRLYVDEGHEFRKLDFPTNRGNIKGIDPSGSQKSMDLYMKVEYLRGKNPNRAVVMASGTPVTNTMGELFTIQRFFNPSQLDEDGDSSFDAWSGHYGEVVDGVEQNAAGGYETVSRFAKFVNLPELMSRVRYFMDVLTSSQLRDLVVVPKIKSGGRRTIVTPIPDGYKDYQKALEQRLKAIKNRKAPPKPGDDIVLNVITDGRFSAIDMRFVDSTLPSDPNSKLNKMLDDLISAYHETADNEYVTAGVVDENKGSSLIVFTKIGLGEQSAKNRGFDMKAWITQRLLEGGVKREHIAFMRDNKAHSKKEKLFEDMRQGKKRILIGGEDMETGVNIQKRLTHLFHLDSVWFPATIEQREGRIIRQGNQNTEIDIGAYVTKGSYDSTMWGIVSRKARFIEQAFRGDNSIRSIDDVSEASAFEMAAALASGDERYLKLAGLKGDVERLSRLYSAHIDEQKRFAREKAYLESQNKHSTSKIEQINEAIAKRKPIKAGEFLANVGKQSFDSREDFSKALFEKFKEIAESYKADEVELGSIAGFPIVYNGVELRGGNFAADLRVDLPIDVEPLAIFPIDPAYSVSGIATRAVNQTNALDKELVGRKSSIEQNTKDLARIGRRIGASFPEMSELSEKQQALNELEQELNAESKADDVVSATVDSDSQVNEDKPKFSRGTGSGLTTTQTRAILVKYFGEKVIKALESSGLLKILETMGDIPSQALKSIQAWHGSPHKFNSFSLAHLGSGEGNQAYGWGLYFAASKEVAEWYRTVLSEQQGKHRTHVTYDGIAYEFSEGSEHEAQALIRALVSKGHTFRDSLEALMELRKYPRLVEARKAFTRIVDGDSTRYTEAEIAKEDKFTKEVILKPRRILKILNEMSIDEGQLYKVDIDVIEDGLLLWDVSFEEQPKVVQQALLALGYKPKAKTKYLSLEEDGGSIYRDLAGTLGGQKEASLALKKNGVDGIKYLDGGSRQAGEGNYNYVVFDDAAVDIVETFYSKNPNGIEGYYHNGQATLIADNLTPETVVATFIHELGGHKGFQELMTPTAYASLMRQFNRLVKQGNAIALAAKARAEAAESTLGAQQDEYLPYLLTQQATLNAGRIQQSSVAKVIEQVYRAVKAWLYRTLSAHGFDGVASKLLQPKDITLLAERMIREMGNGTNPSNNTKAKGSQFSQLNTPQTQINAVRKKYEGTDQWMKAPNGQPTKLNEMQWLQVRTPNFKAWFGDWENDPKNASQVVDSNGEPMVVYHSTKTDSTILYAGGVKEKGTPLKGTRGADMAGVIGIDSGAGIWFSDSSNTAENNSGTGLRKLGAHNVIPVFLNLKKPLPISSHQRRNELKELIPISKLSYPVVPTTIYDEKLKRNVKQTKYYLDFPYRFDWQQKDIIKANGFDGIYMQIPSEDTEIIAFDPTQIKSAIGNTGEFNPTNPDIRFSRTEQNPRSSSLDNFIAKAIAEKAWLTTEQINLLNSATTFDELIPLLDKVWNQYFEAKKLKNNNSTKTAVGVDNIKALIRSEVDSGHITKEHGDLALYFAEKNPALFDSLKSFSFQNDAETLSGNAVGGVYNVVDKVIRISRRTNGSQLTIAHEVLHHAEEFLPENIKSSIIKAWQNDLIRAFKSAENGSNRKTMLHAIIHSIAMGDMSAIEKAIDSMDGVIPANTYHLFNPSEYWAENASRLMNNRSKRQDTWIENARSWINGLIQTLKNALGLQNDAAILKGLRMVLSGSQLKEGGKGIDIDHVYNMKMLNLFSYIGKFNHDGANKTKTSNEKYSRQSKNPITEGIKSAANDAKNSLPDPIAKSIDNFMAGRILPSSDMANITAKTELSIYKRTIGTQLNTALQLPDFKKVYDMAQRYLQHVAVDAYAALKVAPNLLGKLESWSDLKKDVKKIWPANFIKQKADRAAVASIIFDETLNNELLSDADILKALTRDQRQIYKEARDAIQVSLENTAKSEMVRKLLAAEAIDWSTVESMINQDLPVGQFAQAIRDLVESRIGGFKNELDAILDADPKIKDALKTSHDKKLTPQTPAQKLTLKEARLTPEQMRTPAQKLAIEEAKATPNKKQQLTPAQKATLKKAKTLKAQIETTEEALKSLNDVEARLETLIEQGYAPLMRFGEYTLTVRDLDGKVKSFFMFESKSEQVRAVNTIVARYGKTVNLETDMISKEEFKQFAGMTPETVALFAKETGMDKDEAYQHYLKHAIPARSAMTRMIKRKGTEGFSDDIQRVVASFVMSNARMSAKNIYAAQIEKSIQAIESGKSVKDQAYVMKENVFNPKENFAQLRNFLFLWNLGGSIFFGLLNMTQPYMQTLPHLSQYVPIKEAFYAIIKGSGIAGSAMKNGTAPKGYEAEYNRAVREGVVDPQNVFMLSGVERGKTGASNSAWGVITHTMGLIAQVTESFNRKAVFIASLQVAKQKGNVWLKKKGFNSAYDFAKDTVDQTQGVYDKANRSNWANTSVGAPLMVFKQFSINYVEQMVRMWKKEAASGDEGKKAVFLMLALLASLSGVMGLPFIKDILDVSETTAAFLGNPVNIEREARLALGKDLADPLFNGVLNHFVFNNLGMDIQGRTGMPDLVPWSNALNPTLSAQGRINEFASIAGATGGLIEKGYDATQLIARGNLGTAALTLMPRSFTSAFTGGKMAVTDEVMDSKGNKLFDTTWSEGIIKLIDANPKRMADLSRTKSLEWKDFAIQDYMTTSFKQKIIAAMMDKDQAEVNKLMKEVEVWNNARSRYPVYIDLNTLAENANKKDQTFDAREKIRKGMTWVKNERPEM